MITRAWGRDQKLVMLRHWSGLRSFHRQLLQCSSLQLRLNQELFEPIILLLKFLQQLGVLGLHTAVLVLPPIVGGLSDSQMVGNGADVVVFGLAFLGVLELPDDLFRGIASSLAVSWSHQFSCPAHRALL